MNPVPRGRAVGPDMQERGENFMNVGNLGAVSSSTSKTCACNPFICSEVGNIGCHSTECCGSFHTKSTWLKPNKDALAPAWRSGCEKTNDGVAPIFQFEMNSYDTSATCQPVMLLLVQKSRSVRLVLLLMTPLKEERPSVVSLCYPACSSRLRAFFAGRPKSRRARGATSCTIGSTLAGWCVDRCLRGADTRPTSLCVAD